MIPSGGVGMPCRQPKRQKLKQRHAALRRPFDNSKWWNDMKCIEMRVLLFRNSAYSTLTALTFWQPNFPFAGILSSLCLGKQYVINYILLSLPFSSKMVVNLHWVHWRSLKTAASIDPVDPVDPAGIWSSCRPWRGGSSKTCCGFWTWAVSVDTRRWAAKRDRHLVIVSELFPQLPVHAPSIHHYSNELCLMLLLCGDMWVSTTSHGHIEAGQEKDWGKTEVWRVS